MMKIKRFFTKKNVLIATTVVLIAGAASFAYWSRYNNKTDSPDKGQTINMEPATEEEKQETADNKDQTVNRIKLEQEAANNPSTNKKSVKPVITQASDLDNRINVSAYVPGIYEEGGTCTAILTKGGARVTASSEGFGNASTTNCTPIHISRDQFSGGDWSVVVEYNSNTANGTSDAVTVRIDK